MKSHRGAAQADERVPWLSIRPAERGRARVPGGRVAAGARGVARVGRRHGRGTGSGGTRRLAVVEVGVARATCLQRQLLKRGNRLTLVYGGDPESWRDFLNSTSKYCVVLSLISKHDDYTGLKRLRALGLIGRNDIIL